MGSKKKGGILGKATVATRMIDPLNITKTDKSGLLPDGSDFLFGKKDKGTRDRYMPLDPLQKSALGRYGQLLNTSTDQMAKNISANQERQIRSTAGDVERKATQLAAQRGLGNSSVGLNAILNSTRDMGDKLGAVRAGLPGLQYDLKTKNLDNATQGIQNILTNRTFIQGRESMGRVGGLLGQGGLVQTLAPSAIQAAGTYYGAKAGAGR